MIVGTKSFVLKIYIGTGNDYMMVTAYKYIFRDWKYHYNGRELFGFILNTVDYF